MHGITHRRKKSEGLSLGNRSKSAKLEFRAELSKNGMRARLLWKQINSESYKNKSDFLGSAAFLQTQRIEKRGGQKATPCCATYNISQVANLQKGVAFGSC